MGQDRSGGWGRIDQVSGAGWIRWVGWMGGGGVDWVDRSRRGGRGDGLGGWEEVR